MKRGIIDIKKAVSIDDRDNDNYILLGDYYSLGGDYEKAIKEYSYVINRNNIYSLAYIKRGNVYAAMGHVDKAKQDWEVAQKRGYYLEFPMDGTIQLRKHKSIGLIFPIIYMRF